MLFVSHNMATVVQLCTRALLFRGGGLVLDGDSESVVQAYITEGQTEQEDTLDFADPLRPPYQVRAQIISARLNSEEKAGPWAMSSGSPLSLEVQVVWNGLYPKSNSGSRFAMRPEPNLPLP